MTAKETILKEMKRISELMEYGVSPELEDWAIAASQYYKKLEKLYNKLDN